MPRLWPNYIDCSVSRKLAFYIIGIGVVVASIALGVRLIIAYQQSLPVLKKEVEKSVLIVRSSIQNAIEGQDDALLTSQIALLASSPDVNAVRVTWLDDLGQAKKRVYPLSQQVFSNPLSFEFSSQNTFTSDSSLAHIQLIEVDLSLAGVFAEVKREAIKNAIIILIEAIIIGLMIIRFIESMIMRHLRDISHYARRLSIDRLEDGFELSRKSPTFVSDELDGLALSLNVMRQHLHDDVRARQVMELSLIAAKEEESIARRKHLAAEASNKAKSQFIATVSHEIRTPMNGIVGMIDLLSGTVLTDLQKQYIETIKASGGALARVINDILDYSKIEANKLKLESASFHLGELVEECIQLFSAASAQNSVELQRSISSSVPMFLLGDSARLRQVVLSLLGNAFKFTHSGSICLSVSLAETVQAHEEGTVVLYFSVSDTGIGIDQESQNNVFEPFKQVDGTLTRQFGGTGLGLAIAKNLVELMGGEMGCESELGKGACFWFTSRFELTMPFERKGGGIPDKVQQEPLRFTHLKALVVEDNPVNCMVIEGILSKLGLKVCVANNGRIACDMFKVDPSFDIIFMDCEMPVMDGFAATLQIRAWERQERYSQTHIVAITAHVESDHKRKVFECGMNHYLSKPITVNDISSVLAELGFQPDSIQPLEI